MTAAEAEAMRRRLDAVLALTERAGSPGEREAAQAALGRLIGGNSEYWRRKLVEPTPAPHRRAPDWRTLCEQCLQRPGYLRPWEHEFLASLRDFPRASAKQTRILHEIDQRLGLMP